MKKLRVRTAAILLCLLITLLSTTPAYGLTSEQRRVIDSGIRYFNTEESVPPTACPTSTSLSGKDNAEKIWNFLISRGLTPVQAAGVMGNLQQESGFIPDKQQIGSPWPSGGWGIAQWTNPGRRDRLRDAVLAAGLPYSDEKTPKTAEQLEALLAFQLEYMYNESSQRDSKTLPGIKEWEGLKKETTVEGATIYWQENFERAGEPKLDNRLKFANDLLVRFGSNGTGGMPEINTTCEQAVSSGSCSAKTSLPLAADTQIAWFNRTNHGTSISYPQRTNGHNTILHKNNHFGAETVMNASVSVGEAVDIGAAAGTKVFSPTDGKVLRAGTIHRDGSDGYMVIIESANKKCVSVMAHLTQPLVADGSTVSAGQELGRLTDSIANPHLHFELWVDGQPINIGLDSDPCSTGQQGCDSYSDEAEQIWNKQKEALTRGGSNG